MNRNEHMEWSKQRAFEYLDADDVTNAWASMCSDLQKHSETKDHLAIDLGMQMFMMGSLSTVQEMRDFIEGFN